VGDSAPRVAEFSGCQALHNSGLDRQRHHFPAADLLRPLILCVPPIVEEVRGTLLVNNVEQRATCMTVGGMNAESSAKGLLVNIKLPQC
jgi:hypothetical protein